MKVIVPIFLKLKQHSINMTNGNERSAEHAHEINFFAVNVMYHRLLLHLPNKEMEIFFFACKLKCNIFNITKIYCISKVYNT